MEISSCVYHWHSQFNVYVLKNKDVLLLSSGQQLLLPQEQFPFVDEFDGIRSVNDILNTKSNLDEKSSLFLFQINKLLELKLIQIPVSAEQYIKPLFKGKPLIRSIDSGLIKQGATLSIFSLCNEGLVWQFERLLNDKIDTSFIRDKELKFILVDDFLDPRISESISEGYFILIKLTGDAISVSPVFSKSELSLFEAFQGQLLENQPVRKTLERCFSDDCHAYPFELKESLSKNCLNVIETLLNKQLLSTGQNKLLMLYRIVNNQYENHVINLSLDNDVDFSSQINGPIVLQSCISHFNIDGGSRSVSATDTVERLMPLVSPITGVINHLEVIGNNSDSPIKIYRTGFFKTDNKSELVKFDRNSFVQICLGKGVSHAQSKASALSETIERYAALYQADVKPLTGRQSEILKQGYRNYGFQSLVPYSQDQYYKFNLSSHPDSELKQAAKVYQDELIHWLPTWSLTKEEQVYVPLSQCFSNIPYSDDEYGRWHSNGCAAGNTLEEAILQALFELIERDATAIWWYNKLICPIFDLNRIDQDNLSKLNECLSPNNTSGHDYWVLDLTTDLGIPVMGAIGKDKVTGGLVMGFGCHLIPEMAAQRALTELCQLIPIRDQNAAPFDFDEIEEGEYLQGSETTQSTTYAIQPSTDIKDDISTIVTQLASKNMEVLALNYSRAHIPLFTAKVFVPGLCHIWPQLANERLYQAP